jgi:hypothetical protein
MKFKQRSDDQTTLTFSLDKEMAGQIRARAVSLKISNSAYLRLLIHQDLSSQLTLAPAGTTFTPPARPINPHIAKAVGK